MAPCRCSDHYWRPIFPPSRSKSAPAPWQTLHWNTNTNFQIYPVQCSRRFRGITRWFSWRKRIHHHRIPSVTGSKILQAVYIGSERLIPKVDLGDWRRMGIARNKLCFSTQPLALTGWQLWKPRLYKTAFGVELFVASWIIGAGAERQSRTLALHFSSGQGRDRKTSCSFNNRPLHSAFDLWLLTTVKHTTHDIHAFPVHQTPVLLSVKPTYGHNKSAFKGSRRSGEPTTLHCLLQANRCSPTDNNRYISCVWVELGGKSQSSVNTF